MKKFYTLALGLCFAAAASAQVTIGTTNYDTLDAAVNAAQDGDVLTITSDVTVTSRIGFNKKLTIEAKNGARIIGSSNLLSKKQSALLFQDGADVTFNNVIYDGDNIETSYQAFETQENNNTLTLNNVTIQNVKQTSSRTILTKSKTANGAVLNNVSFVNCTGVNVLVGRTNSLVVKGTGEYNVTLEKTNVMAADGFTGKIALTMENSERTVVNGGNVANFTWANAPEFWTLVQNGDNVAMAYTKPVVLNQTQETEYTSLNAALAAATANDVIVLLADVDLTERAIKLPNVTIQSEEGNVYTIKRTFTGSNDLSFESDNGKSFTMKNVIFDQNNIGINASNRYIFNMKGNSVFENVTIKNTTTCLGVIVCQEGKTLSLNNVMLENCEATNVNVDGAVTLNGDTNLSFVCLGTGSVAVGDDVTLVNTDPIVVTPVAYEADAVVVKNYTDPSKFTLPEDEAAANWVLAAKDGNIVLADKSNSAVSIIETEDSPVEYFNLQGVRVANPENGVFIRRQG